MSPSPLSARFRRFLVVALLVAGGTVAAAAPAAASTVVHCGQVITADTRMANDLVNCPNNGLVIGADGITLDLDGHTIDGNGVSVPSCPPGRRCDAGVDNSAGHSHVTVEGGSIRQFTVGVFVQGAAGNHVHRLAISHISGAAVFTPQTSGTVIDDNTMTDPGVVALSMFGASGVLVSGNVASGATGYAMFLQTDRSTIEHNRLSSSEHGFAIDGSDDVVRNNTVSDSGGSIDVFDGAHRVRVEENQLRRVGDGVIVGVSFDTLVRHNVVNATGGDDHGGFGVIMDGSIRTTVDQNVVHSSWSGPAIYVAHLDAPTAPRGNHVTHNLATSDNADGILVDPDATGTLLLGDVAFNSGDDGIDVNAPGTTVTGNIAVHNHDLGIEAVRGVVDGGGNHAAANGNPAQCTNVSCR
jgi:parallel beta-helix repeat protein